ncbi:hypothetical protein Hanom_Chr09g00771361 [Helianthus anomalus]
MSKRVSTGFSFGNNWGYLCFIWSSRSQVNSGPRREFQRTRTRGIWLRLRVLISRFVISIGSSVKCSRSSIVSSLKGMMSVSSNRHFFRFDM